MDEVVQTLQSILEELQEINSKLDDMRGLGMYSIDDLHDAVERIAGIGLYNSISDVCDKLDGVETTITLGSNY